MPDELVLYTHPMSRGRIARWMMEEVGQPYRTEIVAFGKAMKDPAYKAINLMGKVPALIHGSTVVTECAAICAYRADAFPQAGLAPGHDDRRRAPYYRWMFFAAGPLEYALSNKAFGFEVPQERTAAIGYGTLADTLDTLEHAVSQGEYIAGGAFSAADVYVGSHVTWGMEFGTLEKRPAFEAYAARLSARPAARRAKEIDDALMARIQAAG